MDLLHAQAEFGAGRLQEAVIEPSPDGNGWRVCFVATDGGRVTLTDHTGTERLYHSLDHADEAAREVGFGEARIEERF
ncbi:hypothetical protein [Endothiovibrio diazotrophicus]